VQVLGFLIGVGLLVWVVLEAFSPRNRAQLEKLADAPWQLVVAMLGLSVIVVVISGEVFRNALLPVRRIPIVGMHATNAVASLLALLPFKLSIFFRVAVHNRRDGVPLLTIGAWFAAVSAIMACAVVPMLAVNHFRKPTDTASAWLMLAGLVVMAGLLIAAARFFLSSRGWSIVRAVYDAMPKPRVLRSEHPAGAALLERAREGCRMLASPRAVTVCLLLRGLDIGVQGARIYVAARIVGLDVAPDAALVAGMMYFLVGAASPAGQVGPREGAVVLVLGPSFAVVPLIITVAETLVLLIGSVLGIACLRPDRLLRTASSPTQRERAA
jgi:hypothetical protein